jgi:hypothetical protein
MNSGNYGGGTSVVAPLSTRAVPSASSIAASTSDVPTSRERDRERGRGGERRERREQGGTQIEHNRDRHGSTKDRDRKDRDRDHRDRDRDRDRDKDKDRDRDRDKDKERAERALLDTRGLDTRDRDRDRGDKDKEREKEREQSETYYYVHVHNGKSFLMEALNGKEETTDSKPEEKIIKVLLDFVTIKLNFYSLFYAANFCKKEGWVLKQGPPPWKTWKKRWLVLTPSGLSYFSAKVRCQADRSSFYCFY